MSQQPISTRSILPVLPRVAPTRPSLRVVTPPARTASRAPFVVLCSLLMTFGLLGLLALNLGLASGSYALHDISGRAEVLRAEQSELEERLALKQTPARLAAQATDLGMVASGTPAYLRLTDGVIIGEAVPAPTPTRDESATAGEGTSSASVGESRERGSSSAVALGETSGATSPTGASAAKGSSDEASAPGTATTR